MRPLVVSMTIAFCLSRLAGSGWAMAGAAQISAMTKARVRIMKTPHGMLEERCVWIERPIQAKTWFKKCVLSAEFGLETGPDRWRHERRHVAAHGRDLAHQCGADRAGGDRRRNEHRLHFRRHGFVHA